MPKPQVDTTALAASCPPDRARWIVVLPAPFEPVVMYFASAAEARSYKATVGDDAVLAQVRRGREDTTALAAAVEALGRIAHALAGRRLLERMRKSPDSRETESAIRAELEAQALTDLQLEKLAGDAQEAAALVLAEAGVAGYSVRTCDGGIGSAEYERYMETQRKD